MSPYANKVVTARHQQTCCLLSCLLFVIASAGQPPWSPEPDTAKSDFDARWTLARLLSYTNNPGSLQEAALEYNRLLKQAKDHPYVLFESARLAFWLGNDEDALQRLNKVVNILPDYLPALELSAKIHSARGHFSEAENYFQRARVQSDGKDFSALIREWSNARLTSGDYYGAEELIRPLLVDKASIDADWLRLADILKAEQRFAEAEGVYWRCLAVSANAGEFLLGMADLRYREKKYAAALQWLNDYKERFDVTPDFYLQSIRCLSADGRYGKVWEMCYELREIDPTKSDPWLEMGKLALKQNRQDLATEFFSAARSCDSNRIDVIYFSQRSVVTNNIFLAGLTNQAGISAME